MSEIRILHWNIHSWLDGIGKLNDERVADLISRTAPDVVSLVEVDEPHGSRGPLAKVAASCGYSPVFCPAFEFGDEDGPRGAFGNAILTHLPVLAVRHHHLLWPVPSYDGSESSEARTVTFVDVATESGTVTAATTHLPRSDESARRAATARLTEIIDRSAERWFVAGDFNTPSDWARETGLTVAPSAPMSTYPADNPNEAIDYIITATSFRVISEAVLEEPGSDHFPVLVTLSLG